MWRPTKFTFSKEIMAVDDNGVDAKGGAAEVGSEIATEFGATDGAETGVGDSAEAGSEADAKAGVLFQLFHGRGGRAR